MKNILNITNSGEQLISSIDDGTNQLIINDSVIPESQYIGSGTYTATISGHNITIAKTTGSNIMLIRNSEYDYSLVDVPSRSDPVDWIIDQGTNGSWKYRKWHSGKVEAWVRWNVGTVAITTASPTYGGYRSDEQTLTIPSGIFTVAPYTVGSKTYSMGGWLSHIRASSATSITVYYGAGASTTIQNQTIDIYAWQN